MLKWTMSKILKTYPIILSIKFLQAVNGTFYKIYKQKHWPENGKLIFVNQKLIENDINCAKIIAFDRSDSYFNTGFLLEEYLPGKSADHITFGKNTGKEYYKRFAQLVSRIHQIHIENFGYIGAGVASNASLILCQISMTR